MKQVFCWIAVGVCWASGAWLAGAQDLSKLSEADRKQVGEWMEQRAATMVESHKIEREVSVAWSDSAYTTPQIEALRARFRELQEEMIKIQRELQKQVLELPAVQEKSRKADELKKKEQELAKKIAEKTGK